MSDREIKYCDMCGEQDLIEINKSHCSDCLEKRRIERKRILSI